MDDYTITLKLNAPAGSAKLGADDPELRKMQEEARAANRKATEDLVKSMTKGAREAIDSYAKKIRSPAGGAGDATQPGPVTPPTGPVPSPGGAGGAAGRFFGGGAAGGAAGGAGRFGGAAAAAARFLPLIGALGALTGIVIALRAAFDKLKQTAEELINYVRDVSPDIAREDARQQVRQVQQQIKISREQGANLARYLEAQNRIANAWMEIKATFTKLFLPLITKIQEGIASGIELSSDLLKLLTGDWELFRKLAELLVKFLENLGQLPGFAWLGQLGTELGIWLRNQNQPEGELTLEEQIDRFFTLEGPFASGRPATL